MKAMYELWYRHGTPPWVIGPRVELREAVASGRLPPGRAVDLGCGEGDNAIFLAQHGFTVTGVDYAASAIDKARAKAAAAGVSVDFRVGDLTSLPDVHGPFDLLVDYGTFDDLTSAARPLYMRTVLGLVRPGSRFLFWCFEWRLSAWERFTTRTFSGMALDVGEAEATFRDHFDIERIAGSAEGAGWMRGYGAYLMTARAPA